MVKCYICGSISGKHCFPADAKNCSEWKLERNTNCTEQIKCSCSSLNKEIQIDCDSAQKRFYSYDGRSTTFIH